MWSISDFEIQKPIFLILKSSLTGGFRESEERRQDNKLHPLKAD